MKIFEAESKLQELNNLINKEKSLRFVLSQMVEYLNEINKSFDENLREP